MPACQAYRLRLCACVRRAWFASSLDGASTSACRHQQARGRREPEGQPGSGGDCTLLYCTVLYRTVPLCTVLAHVLYRTVLYFLYMYCTVLLVHVLYCTLHVLYCTSCTCTVLYFLYMYCTPLLHTRAGRSGGNANGRLTDSAGGHWHQSGGYMSCTVVYCTVLHWHQYGGYIYMYMYCTVLYCTSLAPVWRVRRREGRATDRRGQDCTVLL
jgi:hypothetical protein